MLRSLKIKTAILLLVGFLLVTMVALTSWSIWELTKSRDVLAGFLTESTSLSETMESITEDQLQQFVLMNHALRSTEIRIKQWNEWDSWREVEAEERFITSKRAFLNLDNQIILNIQKIEQLLQQSSPNIPNSTLLEQIWKTFIERRSLYIDFAKDMFNFMENLEVYETEAALVTISLTDDHQKLLKESFSNFQKQLKAQSQQVLIKGNAQYQSTLMFIGLIFSLVMGLSICFSALIIYRLHRSLNEAVKIVEETTEGYRDLEITVYYQDEVGLLLSTLKKMLVAIETREEQLRAIADSAADGIITIDDQGKIRSFNKAAESMFGYQAHELINKNIRMLMPEPFQSEHDSYITNYLTTGKKKIIGTSREVTALCKDGSTFQMFVSIGEAKIGEQRYFTGILHDLTELHHAKNQSEAANQAKSEFLATMSHEIRTPLNAVIGMSELLQETPLNDEQQQYLQAILRGGETLLGLISDVLDISKIEAKQIEIESILFDLREVVERNIEMMKGQAQKKGLELINEVHSNIPVKLMGDPVRLWQICMNLLSNAIKFTETGWVSLQIQEDLQSNETEKNDQIYHILFTVSDTGIGIPHEKREHIFDRFTQADTSTTRKYGGSGLGLTISNHLVNLMGGRLWLEDSNESGSIFHFTIPFNLGKLEAIHSLTSEKKDPVFLPIRILLAEDEKANQLLLKMILEKVGVHLDIAENGQIAIDSFRSGTYDLILMDIQMPIMSGYDVTRLIREEEKKRNLAPIPIIAMTAFSTDLDLQKCVEVGCDKWMTKPFKKSHLFEMITQLVPKEKLHSPDDQSTNSPHSVNSKYIVTLEADLAEIMPEIIDIKNQEVREIQEAFIKKDYGAIASFSHKLKGSHGIDKLNELADDIERKAQQKDRSVLQSKIEKLKDLMKNLEIRYEES